jgi:transposase
MATADANRGGPLAGHIEIDETILGGRRPPKRKWENKTVVMGMVERLGKIIAGPVPDQTTYTLEGIVNENVVEGSTISTDDLARLIRSPRRRGRAASAAPLSRVPWRS